MSYKNAGKWQVGLAGRKKAGERNCPHKARGPAHRVLDSTPPEFSAPKIIGFLHQRNKPIQAKLRSIKADLLRAALE